jgi:hypothetical protein
LINPACALIPVVLIASAFLARAQAEPTTQPVGPQPTFVGMYINDIYGLDLKRSVYTVDFYIWMRWRGEIDPGNFEFLNGSLELKEHPYNLEVSGAKYVSYHCRGTFHAQFDYRRYPLDEHLLVMEMEDGDYESRKLRYVVDQESMARLPIAALAGWTCGQPQFNVRDNTYETSFGDPSEPFSSSSTYSRFYCTIPISRHSLSIYLKTFLALFISVAIAFLSFVLKPSETDPRFGVGLAAIFGAVSSEIVVTSNLPDMPYLTLADKIHLFSLFMIFLSLLQSCTSLRLFRNNKSAAAARIDRISLFVFPISYAIVVSLLTFLD